MALTTNDTSYAILRASDLPIARLQRYFALVAEGPHTEPERLGIMEEHREDLRGRIAELEAALAMIEHKIDRYGGTLTDCRPAMTTQEERP